MKVSNRLTLTPAQTFTFLFNQPPAWKPANQEHNNETDFLQVNENIIAQAKIIAHYKIATKI